MGTKGFEITNDGAKNKVRVWGNSMQELFRNALRGMAACCDEAIFEFARKKKLIRQLVAVEAVDINTLLVDFLEEAIAQKDMTDHLYIDATFKKFGDNFLEASLAGVKPDEILRDVRAVSDMTADIKRNPETGMFEAMLVFDV